MNDIFLYLIAALVASSLSVVVLCFAAKLIRLRREYTELLIPIMGTVVFTVVFQMGFEIISGFVSFFIVDVVSALAVSQIVYIICRKVGNKSTAIKRYWIFIGIAFLLVIASFCVVFFAKNIKDSFGVLLDLFFACLLNFVLMLFNVIFYKITKEISFSIRKKRK